MKEFIKFNEERKIENLRQELEKKFEALKLNSKDLPKINFLKEQTDGNSSTENLSKTLSPNQDILTLSDKYFEIIVKELWERRGKKIKKKRIKQKKSIPERLRSRINFLDSYRVNS